jgi:hypothetical protein
MVAFSASIFKHSSKAKIDLSFSIAFALKTHKNNHEIGHYIYFISSGSVCANSNAELHKTRNRIYKADFSLTL